MNNRADRPNILLIVADQLRFDALGCYGNTQIHTPNIDSIALNGSTFENHFVQAPVCSPSRCTMMTGRYPKNHGTRDNGIPLRGEEVTLAQTLQEHGYLTAAIGKMHFTTQFQPKEREEEDWPDHRYGFEIVHTTCDTKTGEYLNWLKDISEEDYEIVKMQGERKAREDRASAIEKESNHLPQVYQSNVNPSFHQSAWIADQTIQLVESQDKSRPFFVLCSFVDPHHPFDPPVPYSTMYDPEKMEVAVYKEGELEDKPPHFKKHRTGHGYSNEKYDYQKLTKLDWNTIKAAYYGMITLVDENIGRILDALKKQGMEEDTIVLFTSDHGELLGDHGLLFKGPFMYDSIIKAPMVLKWPGMIPRGARYSTFTEHVDLMPTLLDFVGITVPYGVQGRSLGPILRGDSGAGRKYALTEFNCYDWALNLKTLTGKDFKLTYYAGEAYGELYDRRRDPEEFENLWGSAEYTDIKCELLKELMDRIIETEDTLPIRIGKY